MMLAEKTGELGLPARAATVFQRVADRPQTGGGHIVAFTQHLL